jgi:hypothetical protein
MTKEEFLHGVRDAAAEKDGGELLTLCRDARQIARELEPFDPEFAHKVRHIFESVEDLVAYAKTRAELLK